MKIHVLQHVPFESLGMIADWAKIKGHKITTTKFYEGGAITDLSTYDALVIMGGPMSVHDEAIYPWLTEEKNHIYNAIKAGKHVLGVCLGAQLIADVLGAKVSPMPAREIGWFPIAWRDEAMGSKLLSGINPAMNVFHWHGEQFTIPDGAIHIASSKACANQAFLYKEQVLGLQFHLEMDDAAIEAIIKNCGNELEEKSDTIQTATKIRDNNRNIFPCKTALFRLLDNWIS